MRTVLAAVPALLGVTERSTYAPDLKQLFKALLRAGAVYRFRSPRCAYEPSNSACTTSPLLATSGEGRRTALGDGESGRTKIKIALAACEPVLPSP